MQQLLNKSLALMAPLIITVMSITSFAADIDDDEALPAVEVKNVRDLTLDAKQSHQEQKPILLFFAMEGCSWCRYVEEEHLKPMLRNARYRDQVIIRKVMTDNFGSLTDFNGKKISTLDLSTRYRASFTPTVIFVDHAGRQIAPRILGVRNTEMYGGDLDDGIKFSRKLIQQQLAANL